MWQTIAVVLWCALGLLPVFGQQILVNRQNKTIAITAEDSVSVDPEVATITVGYQNYAATKDAAYEKNIRVSNEVTKALLNGGVPKSALETESLRLERAERDEKWTAEEKKELDQSTKDSFDYLPFGERLAGGSSYEGHLFTGDEYDWETGLNHTWFRKYSSQLGRWMTPDPAGLAAAGPTNPQSWNRYAYVINNPLTYVDPSGMDFCSSNSPYTTGGGGTNNLPTPDCVPTGIPNYYDASYNGLPPDWQNQTWQAVDTWFNNQGITEYAPLPTGLLNYNANQGDLGMLGSQERAIGFKYVVSQIIADWTKYGLNPNSTLWLQYDLGENAAGTAAALNAVNIDVNVLNGLGLWQSISVPTVPPAPCVMKAGLAMGVWKAQLLAWLKSHPGQAPPPAIATPPSLSGVCG